MHKIQYIFYLTHLFAYNLLFLMHRSSNIIKILKQNKIINFNYLDEMLSHTSSASSSWDDSTCSCISLSLSVLFCSILSKANLNTILFKNYYKRNNFKNLPPPRKSTSICMAFINPITFNYTIKTLSFSFMILGCIRKSTSIIYIYKKRTVNEDINIHLCNYYRWEVEKQK